MLTLRPDLTIKPASPDATGIPGLIIQDPLRHRFFRLPVSQLSQDEDTAEFLIKNRLTTSSPSLLQQLNEEHRLSRHSIFTSLIHNYLFFRIPIVHPEPFLDATINMVRPFASRTFILISALIGLIGCYFAIRQWDHFSAMAVSSFTLTGAATFAVTLFTLKIFHELGHAYVSRHYSVRVPSIGLAFMMMAPMLYTDATDAWRLTEKWQRFRIGAAGVIVELVIACYALFLWAFLPDGPARAISFFVSVTAVITSLAVNLSPFMRFDGYHMLADALSLHNIGPRSFALTTWRLKELLFKPDEPPPEFFAPALRRFLISYAIGTWAYRLSLFLGIAWLVYVTLPKAVGLPLAFVEVYFFILLPIIRTLKDWKAMGLRNLFGTPRALVTSATVLSLLVLAGLPLDRRIHMPAVLLPGNEAQLFPPEPAQVIQVNAHAGDKVEKGQILARLMVPDIGYQQRMAKLRQDIAGTRLLRVAADAKGREQLLIVTREYETASVELDGLRQRGELLVLKSPMSGTITGDAAALRQGQWVGQSDLLFQIVDGTDGRIIGLMPERDADRLLKNATATFMSSDGLHMPLEATLKDVGLPGAEGRSLHYLSSLYGGPVAMEQGGATLTGHLPVAFAAAHANPTVTIGTIIVDAEPQSLLGFLAGRVVTVMLRESGF